MALVYVNGASISDLWRFVASHWVHWSVEHLVWSAGAFLVLGIVCERRSRRRFLVTTLVAAVAIPVALRLLQPDLLYYGGLSGIDSALFGLICAQDIRTHGRNQCMQKRGQSRLRSCLASLGTVPVFALPIALLIGFLAKIGYEFFTGAALFVSHSDMMIPVPLAHLVGIAVGILVGLDLHRVVLWERDAFRIPFPI
jgi:rhomboid family GlyGly-CTERM serine protease